MIDMGHWAEHDGANIWDDPSDTFDAEIHVHGEWRVWWIPQVPMQSFQVPVQNAQQGKWLCDVLADYDQFQFDHNVKPDYCNTGGVQQFVDGEWEDWEEDEF